MGRESSPLPTALSYPRVRTLYIGALIVMFAL